MSNHVPKPALPPLWMERADHVGEMIQEPAFRRIWPQWDRLVAEAGEMRLEVERGDHPRIPPRWTHDLADGFGIAYEQVKDYPVPVDPHVMAMWGGLPSANAFIRTLLPVMARRAGTAINQQAMMGFLEHAFFRSVWEQYGKKVYVVDPMTFELLARTDLPDLPASVLRPPVPNFYLRFPEGAVAVETDAMRPVEGVWISFGGMDPQGLRLVQTLTTSAPPRPGVREVPMTMYAQSALTPEMRLGDFDFGMLKDLTIAVRGVDELMEKLPRVVLGICLYMQSAHPYLEPVPPFPRIDTGRLQNPAKIRKAKQRNARHSRLGYIYLGGHHAVQPQEQAERTEREGRRLEKQVWVRGHWRNQAYGPGHQYHRLTWIEPHVKGPDYAQQEEARIARIQSARPRQPNWE